MAVTRIQIEPFLEKSAHQLILDVRSPSEFAHAHLPGAQSFPLFTDEERRVVGTAYKQESREKAIRIGLDFFGPKMRPMVEAVEALISQRERTKDPKPEIFLYCWRGGMRSSAVAWLLDLYGFRVYTLAGGYKSFRNHVLSLFSRTFPLRILGGYTGSGKTEVLQQMQSEGKPVIDLEALASHKGSAFGSFKMPPQPTQEMFENLLGISLRHILSTHSISIENPIWLEDESQRIGNLNLPGAFWKQMREAPISFLEISFDKRLAHLVEEYGDCKTEKLIDAVQRITKRLGPAETKAAKHYLVNNNFEEAFRILLQYYDKRYVRALHNRNEVASLLTLVPAQAVTPSNAALLIQYQLA